MVAVDCCFVCAENPHAIGASNPSQGESPKLDQVPALVPSAGENDVMAGSVVIDKREMWDSVRHEADVKWCHVAVNKTGQVQTGSFCSEGA